MMNKVLLGENLEILKTLGTGSVDLCYIDPPFFTQRDWGGFDDRFASREAYLVWLGERIREIHRCLKETGSFYLHLDCHVVHYAKVLCDEIFGEKNFRNEIIWKRTTGGGNTTKKKFGTTTDSILFYTKSGNWTFNKQYRNYDEEYLKAKYRYTKDGRRYRLGNLSAPNYSPQNVYEYKGYRPPKKGWRWTKEKMQEMDQKGYVSFPDSKEKRLRQIRYRDEQKGVPVDNLWIDIPPVNSQAKERTGWPTQKPLALLERIIQSSSKEGDVVLDCFAGSGTTLKAAQRLGRNFIGIEKSPEAVEIIKERLTEKHEKSS